MEQAPCRILMRSLFVFLIATLLPGSFSLHADDAPRRILISGLTWHEKETLDDGTELNRYNLGIGYERDYFKEYKKIYYTYHVMLMSDSHRDPFLYLAGSKSVRFHLARIDTSVGLAAYIGVKNMRFDDGEYRYAPVVGLAPVASAYAGDFTFNVTYVPGIDFGPYTTVGFAYFYIGWEL